jgi:hypothetical protein
MTYFTGVITGCRELSNPCTIDVGKILMLEIPGNDSNIDGMFICIICFCGIYEDAAKR